MEKVQLNMGLSVLLCVLVGEVLIAIAVALSHICPYMMPIWILLAFIGTIAFASHSDGNGHLTYNKRKEYDE